MPVSRLVQDHNVSYCKNLLGKGKFDEIKKSNCSILNLTSVAAVFTADHVLN